uniref:Putative secreted peptide n=1 Tax=Anopheles braziliensis TaxID=58242 RepID=A0A2M3ZRX4_9DIPT
MLAPSAARTVSLTLCIRFCALPTSISVASRSSSEPWAPSMVALTVDRIFSCVPIVGIRSHTCSRLVRIRLSVHWRASSFANRVTSSDASAIFFAVAISSRLLPFESARTSSERRAISTAIRLAAAMISLSFDDH